MVITTETVKGVPSALADFLKTLKTPNVDKQLFGSLYSKDTLTASTFVITASDEHPLGILVYKQHQINKRNYFTVVMLYGQSKEVYNTLVEALLENYKAANVDGIFTELLPANDSDLLAAFTDKKFQLFESVYCISKSSLVQRLSNKSSLTQVRFTSKNRSQYSRIFSDLLIDFDSDLYQYKNTTLAQSVFPSVNKSSRNQRIRISYFIDTVVKSSNWYVNLLFEDETPIGFVKSQVTNQNLCYIDFYIKEKFFAKYAEAALLGFAKIAQAERIAAVSTKSDKLNTSAFERYFNKAQGHSYFFS